MQKFTFSLLLLFVFILQTNAQDTSQVAVHRYQRLDVSYIFGGQIYNNNLIYNPGFSMQASYGLQLNESVGIGLGAGYFAMHDEHFMPFFIETLGVRKNKASSPMVSMQIGYSLGWYAGEIEVEGYEFRGGAFIDAGLGRKININREYSIFFHWSYRHQFARMSYEVFGGKSYTEGLNYDMIVISLGLIRH